MRATPSTTVASTPRGYVILGIAALAWAPFLALLVLL